MSVDAIERDAAHGGDPCAWIGVGLEMWVDADPGDDRA
jgi:hypothetical protein